jgi:hypothetical protein
VCEFPRVDLTIDVDGVPSEYSFFLGVQSQVSADFSYAAVSLTPGAYREGQITIGGKTHRVALVDYNSNGRFDDQVKADAADPSAEADLSGDVLLVDPDPDKRDSPEDVAVSEFRHYVSKISVFDRRLYDVKISPAGDTLSIAPSKAAFGRVACPFDRLYAVVYGEQGALKLVGEKSKPIDLPVGRWRLLQYTIEHAGAEPPAKGAETEKKAGRAGKGSMLKALVEAIAKPAGDAADVTPAESSSSVSARGVPGGAAFQVTEGQIAKLPFGPPYKPVVTAEPGEGGEAGLRLSIVGSGGERCTSLTVKGSRPDAPEFTILDPKGEVVEQGNFKYG